MKHQFIKKISCTDCKECFEGMINSIETKLDCVLHADKQIKEVHGSVSCLHEKNNHIITVEFYEKQKQNGEILLKKLGKIPTEKEIKKII